MNTINLWEQENPVITNLSEIENMKNHIPEHRFNSLTLRGIIIDKHVIKSIKKILYSGRPFLFRVDNCIFPDDIFEMYDILNCTGYIEVNNCGLTPEQGKEILEYLDPYSRADVDLSNNCLGGEGCEKLLKYTNHAIRVAIRGFGYVKLSNNGFSQEDIESIENESSRWITF